MCFEPVAVLAITGFLMAVLWRKEKSLIIIAGCVIMMTAWRILNAGAGSSRYGVGIVIPALLAVVYSGICVESFFVKYVSSKKYCFPIIFCVLISAACLCNLFILDPYHNSLIEMGKFIRKVSAGKKSIILDHSKGNGKRIAFYANSVWAAKKYWTVADKNKIDTLKYEAAFYKQLHDDVYAVVSEKKQNSFSDKDGIELVFSSPTNSKKRKFHSLYRISHSVDMSQLAGQINLTPNGDFSKIKKMRNHGIPDQRKLIVPGNKLPEIWKPNFGDGFPIAGNSEIEVVKGWSGNALRLSSKSAATIFPDVMIPVDKKTYTVYFEFIPLENSNVLLKSYEFNSQKQWSYRVIDQFTIQKHNKLFTYCNNICFEESDKKFFRIGISVEPGNIIIDNIKTADKK